MAKNHLSKFIYLQVCHLEQDFLALALTASRTGGIFQGFSYSQWRSYNSALGKIYVILRNRPTFGPVNCLQIAIMISVDCSVR